METGSSIAGGLRNSLSIRGVHERERLCEKRERNGNGNGTNRSRSCCLDLAVPGRSYPLLPVAARSCRSEWNGPGTAQERPFKNGRSLTGTGLERPSVSRSPFPCSSRSGAFAERTSQLSMSDSDTSFTLIDSKSALESCLSDVETLMERADAVAAVDFEGINLCRTGRLCTMQILCRGGETTYVIDVVKLGKDAFTHPSSTGFTFKRLLECPSSVKLFFDPRRDADALYHQFAVYPRKVFCLQLADVADRRRRGLKVRYVSGLQRVLDIRARLTMSAKSKASSVKARGKRLFLPELGGCYSVWERRPLAKDLIEYAAGDVEHMITLYDKFRGRLGRSWMDKVWKASKDRVDFCLAPQCHKKGRHLAVAPII